MGELEENFPCHKHRQNVDIRHWIYKIEDISGDEEKLIEALKSEDWRNVPDGKKIIEGKHNKGYYYEVELNYFDKSINWIKKSVSSIKSLFRSFKQRLEYWFFDKIN